MSAVSLFSGSGGFDYGAKQAGLSIMWANDNSPVAVSAYRSLLPDVTMDPRDVREVGVFPEADVLIGCYPCTGFSLASRRRHHSQEERDLHTNPDNFLFREFLRALKKVQPQYLFVENVGGMKSADAGWFFREQVEGFNAAGYRVQHRLLSAADFGTPQDRKRLFIVGVHKDLPDDAYAFPEPTHGNGRALPKRTMRDAIWGWPEWPDGEFFDYPFHGHYLTRQRKRAWDRPSYTIVADAHHVPLHPMGEPMAYVSKDNWKLVGDKNRRLSWRECAALQGLPPDVEPSGSLRNKYRAVGNAVPPALGRALVSGITGSS